LRAEIDKYKQELKFIQDKYEDELSKKEVKIEEMSKN